VVLIIVGPLTKSGTNVIVGMAEGGRSCREPGIRVGIYQDLLKLEAQEFIIKIVEDLEIEGGSK
jgi:hypothetical protein